MRSSPNAIRFGAMPNGISLSPRPEGAGGTLSRELACIQEENLQLAEQEGYRRGVEEATARIMADLQEQRDALSLLQEGTLHNLAQQHAALVQQVGSALPPLALEITRRVLAGFEPDVAHMARLVEEVLREIAPGTTEVEIWLSHRDLELLREISPEIAKRYPGLILQGHSDLQPGDCRAKSRFGAVDARLSTRLKNVERSLAG